MLLRQGRWSEMASRRLFCGIGLVVIGLIPTPALAQQCEGAVVLKETVARAKPKADAAPTGRLKYGTALIAASGPPWFLIMVPVCTFREKDGYLRVATVNVVGDRSFASSDAVWVDAASVRRFSYSQPGRARFDGMLENCGTEDLAKRAALIIDEIAFRDFKPPEVKTTFSFGAPSEQVWPALVEVLAGINAPFELVERSSGLITTKAIPDPLHDTMVCATALGENYVVTFNAFLKDVPGGSSLRINATFAAARDNRRIACYSNGTLEAWLSEKVSLVLAGK